MAPDDRVASTLAEIKGRYAARIGDVERLVAAIEAVLKLADGWNALWPCSAQVREAITTALTGETSDAG